MAKHDLIAITKMLNGCLQRAGGRLEQRQKRLIQQLIELGKDGEPKTLSWRCRLPSGDGRYRTQELLQVPWASLRNPESMQISSLSITFKGKITADKRTAAGSPPALIMTPTGGTGREGADNHQLQITLGGAEKGGGRISLDNVTIKSSESEDIEIPGQLLDRIRSKKPRSRAVVMWTCLSVILLIVMLAVVCWWFKDILEPPW